ncbi:PilX N-terminal domain-containing pilus assembly protein, partial [Planctomycetota bacterium]
MPHSLLFSPGKCKGGIVLIFVLGALALLSILALSFVTMTGLEKSISRNYVDRTQALLCAESGVEYALSHMLSSFCGVLTPKQVRDMQYEENADAKGLLHAGKVSFDLPDNPKCSGIVSGSYTGGGDYYKLHVEDLSGKININDTNGNWNLDTDPYRDADEFGKGDDTDVADSISSGRLQMMFEALVNAVFPDHPQMPDLGINAANLLFSRRDELGGRFGSWEQVKDALVPGVLDADEFNRLKAHLTLHNWQDPHTIRPTFKLNISTPADATTIPDHALSDVYLFSDWQTKGFQLEPRSPVNINTASPEVITALLAPVRGWYLREGPGESYSFNHYEPMMYVCKDYATAGWDASWWMSMIQYYHTDNTQPFLVIDDNFVTHESRFGQGVLTPALEDIRSGFTTELAEALYHEIHDDDGNPVETWEEFEFVLGNILEELLPVSDPLWIDSNPNVFWKDWKPGPAGYDLSYRYNGNDARNRIPQTHIYGGWVQDSPWEIDIPYWRDKCLDIQVDVLLANFNPNSDIQNFNPDRHMHRHVDKAHLTQYSSELIFEPTGYFSIESRGIVGNQADEILAQRHLEVVVSLFDIARITTQSQFMKGIIDESGAGTQLDNFFSQSAFMDTAYDCSLMCYPEPYLDGGNGKYIKDSIYDGYLMAATYSFDDYGNTTFSARFNGKLEADNGAPTEPPFPAQPSAGASKANQLEYYYSLFTWKDDFRFDGKCVGGKWVNMPVDGWLPRNLPTTARLTWEYQHPVYDAPYYTVDDEDYIFGEHDPVAGVLFPDGALSDAGRCLGYEATQFGSTEGRIGGLHFWIKPNFDTQNSSRIRRLFLQTRRACNFNCFFFENTLTYFPHYGFHKNEYYDGGINRFELAHNAHDDVRWLPPCSLAFGWGWDTDTCVCMAWGATHSAVDDMPNRDDSCIGQHPDYHFEPHQWSFVLLGWDQDYHGQRWKNDDYVVLTVNGKETNRPHRDHYGWNNPYNHLNLHSEPDNSPVYAQFGVTDYFQFNYCADTTYDEILSYESYQDASAFESTYGSVGRYYSPPSPADTPVYFSPSWSRKELLPRQAAKTIRLRSISWTCYWPDFNYRYDNQSAGEENPHLAAVNTNGDPLGYNPNLPGDVRDDPLAAILGWSGADDPIAVDIGCKNSSGSVEWAADMNGNTDLFDNIDQAFTYPGGSRVFFKADGYPFQLEKTDELVLR